MWKLKAVKPRRKLSSSQQVSSQGNLTFTDREVVEDYYKDPPRIPSHPEEYFSRRRRAVDLGTSPIAFRLVLFALAWNQVSKKHLRRVWDLSF